MKILRIVTRLNIGGPSIQIKELSKLHMREDIEQIIICGAVDKNEKQINISDLNNLICMSKFRKKLNPFYDLYYFVRIIIIIRKFKPDIIV